MPLAPPVALSIAGFDPSSGAGITADLAVFAVFGLFGTSAITTKTVQNTRGVAAREDSTVEHLGAVLEHLEADLPPGGVKIGALGNGQLAETTAKWLSRRKINIPVVWDPALVSSSGAPLLELEDVETLHTSLLPEVGWITPNWAELAALSGQTVASQQDVLAVSATLMVRHPDLGIVVTGGDCTEPVDWLFEPGKVPRRFAGEHVESTSTHGTGCAFSSAFVSGLIHGKLAGEAVADAKAYVTEAIRRAPGLGSGRGPLALYWPLQK